ncbi:glycosyltransferase [Rhodopirellula sallentina]|uniref:Uncharacterized protein n=1 Tax=Rhodopirellula sallentina SM41 TaxID=1263870 RepID=M5TSY1_9BACT|nr:glycosyltransferase [Rhodopirellula sallentina]EMI52260.1 hypothetical protein RSSM_06288 [Rhodopirellula sallentina SM41]
MKWLIVEDALKNRKGHWLEYISTFQSGLKALGHEVTILSDRSADDFIASQHDIHPVLPESIWDRMGDNAGRLTRYLRVPTHAWNTNRAVKRWIKHQAAPDLIFVPTVLVHHLLGWWRLYQSTIRHSDTKLLLFFPNTPLTYNDETGQAMLGQDPTARLFGWLIGQLAEGVRSGQVILGVETHSMRDALSEVTGVPFTYLPHPVESNEIAPQEATTDNQSLHFGCYGAARHEKGSDLLQAAIRKHLDQHPDSDSRFSIQWLGDFHDANGNLISPDPTLLADERVTYIREYFGDGGYDRQLDETDVMLLPYREPYRYRVSRVVIEAMVRGMPVIATQQTTLWEQTEQFGAGVACELNHADSLCLAISDIESRAHHFKTLANHQSQLARRHFSVDQFVRMVAACDSAIRETEAT